jgi:hypothetical protein
MGDELRKEVILPVGSRRPVNPGDFEVLLTRGVDDVNIRRKAEFGEGDVGQLNNSIIPKKKDPSSSPVRRALRKTP